MDGLNLKGFVRSLMSTLLFTGLLSSCVPGSGRVDIEDEQSSSNTTTSGGTSTDSAVLSLSLFGPTSIERDSCSPFSVVLKSDGSATAVADQDYTVSLSGAGNGAFYSDNTCSTTITEVSLLTGSSSGNFFVRDSTAEMLILKASESSADVGEGSIYVSVTNGSGGGSGAITPSTIVFNGPSNVTTSSCTPIAIVLKSAGGISANTNSNMTINLSGIGNGSFYSDSGCSSAITNTTISSGSSHGIVYYSSNVAESLILQADDAGANLSSASHSLSVAVDNSTVATKLSITGSRNLSTSTCSNPYIVRTLNSSDGETVVSANTTVNLNGAAGGTFYSDAGCTSSITSMVINNGTSSKAFYYRSNIAVNPTFIIDDTGSLTPVTLDVIVSLTGTSVAEAFNVVGPSGTKTGVCSTAFTLRTVDGVGSATGVSSSTAVTLAGKGAGNFYSDAGCTSIITGVTFASGESVKQFYYSNDTVETLNFNFDDSGSLIATSKSYSVTANTANTLEITGASAQNVNECQAYVISTKDAGGNLSNLTSSTSVNFSGASSGSFYSDSSCTSATSNVLMTSGQGQKVVYYKNSAVESVTLGVAATGFTGDTLGVNVQSLPASKLALATVSDVTAGDCSALTVYMKDTFDSNVVSAAGDTVNLALSGSGTLYSDAGCTSSITSTTITTGTSSVVFYYQNTSESAETLNATHASLSADSESFNIVAAAPSKLDLTGSATIGAGACAAYTLSLMDTHDNLVNPATSQLIQLAGGGGSFYSDSSCSSSTSSVIISNSEKSKIFYYQSNSGETPTFSTTNTNGLANDTLAITVTVGAPSILDSSLSNSVSAGSCNSVSIYSRDGLGNLSNLGSNTTITLADTGSGTFYSDAGCTSSITTATINSGTAQADLYYRNNTAEVSAISFSGGGLTQFNKSLTTNALAASKLVLTGSAAISVGSCFGYTLSTQDAHDNAAFVASLTIVNMTGVGSGSFYSDALCSTAITSTVFLTSENSKLVYFKDDTAESLTLNLDDAGALTAATFALSTQALPASKLELAGPSEIAVNSCGTYTIDTVDTLGNAVNVGSNLTVNLAKAAAGDFYSDSGCTTSVTTTTVSSGTSQATVYYQAATPAESNISVSATSFASDSDNLKITPLAPSALDLLGPTTATVGDCLTLQISVKDSLGNLSPLTENHTINLTAASGGAFYSDSSCGLLKTAENMSQGDTFALVYYKPGQANTGSLSIDDLATGLDLTADSITLTANAAGTAPVDSGLTAIKLRLTGVNAAIMGTCVGPFNVESLDTNDEIASVNANKTISLTETALTGSKFFSDSSCASEVSSITMSSGQSKAIFYVQMAQVGNASLGANTTGLLSGTMTTNSFLGAKLEVSDFPATGEGFALSNGVTVTDSFTVTIKNTGQAQASGISEGAALANGYSYTGGTFPGTGATCVDNGFLNPSESCTIKLSFSIATLGKHETTFALDYQDGSATREIRKGLTYVVSSKRYPIKMAKSSFGASHNCVLYNDATVACWGNGSAALGRGMDYGGNIGYRDTARERIQSMERVPRLKDVKDIFVGTSRSCALKDDNKLVCWGSGSNGSLGQGNTSDYGYNSANFNNPLPEVDLGAGFVPTEVAIGNNFNCALSTTGEVKCWGQNNYGQLGLGNTSTMGDSSGEMGDNLDTVNLGLTGTEKVAGITVGQYYACARTDLGNVKCWGYNNYGQLGYGDTTNRGTSAAQMGNALQKVNLGAGNKAIDISAGFAHTCAVVQDQAKKRSVRCWGYNNYGQLGIGSTTTQQSPQAVDLGSDFDPVRVENAYYHTCALSNDRKVKCWGYGNSFRLGNYSNNNLGDGSGEMGDSLSVAPIVQYGSQVIDLQSYNTSSCAFLNNNSVKCWGNAAGMNGINNNGQTSNYNNVSPELQNHRNKFALDVGVGLYHGCAIWVDGNASCWGSSNSSSISVLGDGEMSRGESSWIPLNIDSAELPLKKMFSGATSNCVITQTDKLMCWGNNGNYNLGLGDTTARNYPTEVPLGLGDVPDKLAIGDNSMCLLLQSGEVKCWGYNGNGELGIESTTQVQSANAATAIDFGSAHTNVTDLYAGASYYCAVLDSGVTKCWGQNTSYQLGYSHNDNVGDNLGEMGDTLTGIDVGVGKTVVSMGLGQSHSCAGLSDNSVMCWGNNSNGRTGLGLTSSETIEPATVLTSSEAVTSVSANLRSACVSFNDGTGQCWGYNYYGQVGNDTTTTTFSTPQNMVQGGSYRFIEKIVSNHTGESFCALLKDTYINDGARVIKCWGDNLYGRLGYGDNSYFEYNSYGTSYRGLRGIRDIGAVVGPVIQNNALNDYIVPGSYSYEVPNGVEKIKVSVWGAGGGGIVYGGTSVYPGYGGAFSTSILDVTPGDNYNLSVGAGGRGGTSSGNNGEDSFFDGITAGGGAGGYYTSGRPQATSFGGDENFTGFGSNYGYGGWGYGVPFGSYSYVGYTSTASYQQRAVSSIGSFPGGGGNYMYNYQGAGRHHGGTGGAGRVLIEKVLPNVIVEEVVQSNSNLFETPGVYVYTVPNGVTSIRVRMWGAGGAGGSSGSGSYRSCSGGSGAYVDHIMVVTPGQSYLLQVGAGGKYVTSNHGEDGGDTRLGFDSTVIIAGGGRGGSRYNNSSFYCNGSSGHTWSFGGTGSGGVIVQSGNDGGDYLDGANAPLGGEGGAKGTTSNGYHGRDGAFPGGGGGAHYQGASYHGGNGGDGKIEITPF